MTTIQTTDGMAERSGSGRSPLLLAGLGLGGALLLGGGAYAAVNLMGSSAGGEQPAAVLPASSAVYVRMDLNPSVGEKVSAVRFLKGLDPEVQERLDSGEDWRKVLWDEAVGSEGSAPADLDYEKDVKPWLGDRMGVGVIPQGDAEPLTLMAVQVKDQKAAEATLQRLKDSGEMSHEESGEPMGWFFEDDYVVLTSEAALEAARAEVAKGDLESVETFASDMKELDGEGVLSVWADMETASKLAEADQVEAMSTGMDGVASEALGMEQAATGRIAAAASFAPDAIEVHGITRGAEVVAFSDAKSPNLALELPADTAAVISMEHGSELVTKAWDYYSGTMPEEVAQLKEQASSSGFTLPDDLATLLGDSVVLSVGPGIVEKAMAMSSGSSSSFDLPVAYRSATDTGKVEALLDTQLQAAGMGDGAGMVGRRVDDGVLTLGVGQTYVDAVATAEGDLLKDSAQFKAALPKAVDADSMFYVDLNAFESQYLPQITDEKARAAVEEMAAVGVSNRQTAPGDGEFTFRVVADSE